MMSIVVSFVFIASDAMGVSMVNKLPENDQIWLAASDESLMRSIKEAVTKKPTAATIDSLVGSKSTLNTSNPLHRGALRVIKLSADDEHNKQIPPLLDMKDVVYWVRPVESKNPKIVGVCWTKKNELIVFFAVGLEP